MAEDLGFPLIQPLTTLRRHMLQDPPVSPKK
jgi:hypothetical protein